MRPLKRPFPLLILTTAASLAPPLVLLRPTAWNSAAQAHQVEIMGDVGATLHIEPDDTPKAGEEVLAWFALTRPGGQTIPLADCNCQLEIYQQTGAKQTVAKQTVAKQTLQVEQQAQLEAESSPVLMPALAPVSAEGYEEIPGATFTLPEVGLYRLAISGEPKQAGAFTPFELDFEVTVAAALPKVPENKAAALPDPLPSAASEKEPVRSPLLGLTWIAAGLVGLGLVGLVSLGRWLKRQ